MLIPVLDNQKHYWINEDEIEKLLKHGNGWLSNHPNKNLIVLRYLSGKGSWLAHGCHQPACAESSFFKKTQSKIVHTEDPQSCEEAVNWWLQLTEQQGGEGFVVKPYDFTEVGTQGLIQPGLKCRGREYLKIIYGPEYTIPENLERLKVRNVAKKRSLALREYALGIEALERFVKREPLYKCHEAIFGILALESEPIDPRL